MIKRLCCLCVRVFILRATRMPPGLLSGKVFWSHCVQSWYCFLLMRCNLTVMVDIAGMDGPCSNVLSCLLFWACMLETLGLIFGALGCIFEALDFILD